MWIAVTRLMLGLGVVGLTACATTSGRDKDGNCYKPIMNACTTGFHEECETGRDGCERCGCSPDRDTEGGPWR